MLLLVSAVFIGVFAVVVVVVVFYEVLVSLLFCSSSLGTFFYVPVADPA